MKFGICSHPAGFAASRRCLQFVVFEGFCRVYNLGIFVMSGKPIDA